ncbi:MAG: oxygen-independent coproporphyrinogen III oxidase [Agarilytica sp.]
MPRQVKYLSATAHTARKSNLNKADLNQAPPSPYHVSLTPIIYLPVRNGLALNTPDHSATPLWNSDLIQKYNLAGPRYTSYPTALQFHDEVGTAHWHNAVEASNQSQKPISLYFHIPFCSTVCYYCACNKIITANTKLTDTYVEHLLKEFDLQCESIDRSRLVKQLHWGGGTPTYLNDDQIQRILQHISATLNFANDKEGEFSIEIHPATVNAKRIEHLRSFGFNRLSIGVQDFDPKVQCAVNRFNSVAEVEKIFSAARDANYKSISVDLIYGLPLQSYESFNTTLDHVIELSPDRISLFNYAHMPHLFKVQKQIRTEDLPEPQEKMRILHHSIDKLVEAGYVYIGMDHFAKADDELAIAQQKKNLHRNFQGYSTHDDCDLFAFGVSSISNIGNQLFQNHKGLNEYQNSIDQGELAMIKGFKLNSDDLIRKYVISELVCNFEIKFARLEQRYGVDFTNYFQNEMPELHELARDGLIEIDDEKISVLYSGRLLVRRICMVFDAYLQKAPKAVDQPRYSRII